MKIRIYKIEQIDETKSKIIQQNSNWKKKKVLKLIEFQHLTLYFLYPEPGHPKLPTNSLNCR